MTKNVSPIDAATGLTPEWMREIRQYDALEIHPCRIVGRDGATEFVEQCDNPADADFWTVYGHCKEGGVNAFEDFPAKAEAIAFRDRLIAAWPHLGEHEAEPRSPESREPEGEGTAERKRKRGMDI